MPYFYYWRCPECGAFSEMARICDKCKMKAPDVGATGAFKKFMQKNQLHNITKGGKCQ